MPATDKIPISQFEDWFENFSKEVDARHYEKLPYNTWRRIRSHLAECDSLYIEKKDSTYRISFYNAAGTPKEINLFDNDKSFGQYIKDHYISNNDKRSYSAYVSDFKGIPVYADSDTGELKINTEWSEPFAYDWRKHNILSQSLAPESIATITYSDRTETLSDTIKDLTKRVENIENDSATKATDKSMNNTDRKEKNMINFNFDFGPVQSDAIRMSPYGMAVKNSTGTYVSYDSVNDKIIDVDVFNFDGSKFMYKMPVALNDIKTGDIIIHNRVPMFVVEAPSDNKLDVIDIFHGESKTVLPATNMFGFNFATKVVSFLDMGTPSKDNPFGNIMPFLMMDSANGKDNDNLFMAMMMSQASGANTMFQNPLFMMALMKNKDNDSDDFFKMMMLSQMMNKPNVVMPVSQDQPVG